MSHEPFPAFPYPAWRETKETLHRICQIVGKIRMAASPARNHWWHVPLLVSARGLTTGPLRDGDTVFGIDLDLVDHRAEVSTIWGDRAGFALPGKSVAQFHHTLARTLGDLGVTTRVADPRPFDMADEIPFPDDDGHAAYDVSAVGTYWRILAQVDAILREAAAPFPGKQSPVCHYWHTFDIAVGRFSGRPAPARESADPVTREAYSHEVISSGFWFGDDRTDAPAFYSYTAPEPDGLAERALAPAAAGWVDTGNGHLAVLGYDDARASGDVRAAALAFYASAFAAGYEAAGWDAVLPDGT